MLLLCCTEPPAFTVLCQNQKNCHYITSSFATFNVANVDIEIKLIGDKSQLNDSNLYDGHK